MSITFFIHWDILVMCHILLVKLAATKLTRYFWTLWPGLLKFIFWSWIYFFGHFKQKFHLWMKNKLVIRQTFSTQVEFLVICMSVKLTIPMCISCHQSIWYDSQSKTSFLLFSVAVRRNLKTRWKVAQEIDGSFALRWKFVIGAKP